MSTNIRWFDENKNERNTTVAVPSDIPTIPSVPKITYDTFTINLNKQSTGVYTVSFTEGNSTNFQNLIRTHVADPHYSVTLVIASLSRRWSLINQMGTTLFFYGNASTSGIDDNSNTIRYMSVGIPRIYTGYEFTDGEEMKIYVEYLT